MTSLRTLVFAGLAATMIGLPAGAIAQTRVAAVQAVPASLPRFIGEQEIGHRIAELITQRTGGQRVEVAFHAYDNASEVPAGSPATLLVVAFSYVARSGDRKSVGLGKSVDVVVDIVCLRTIKQT